MRKALVCLALILGIAVLPGARAAVIFQPDSAIDTSTGLVWLNTWLGDAYVNPHQLVDVSGGWRHATTAEIVDFFFGQFGVPVNSAPPLGRPFNHNIADLILHLGGKASTPFGPAGYELSGWYRTQFFPGPATFDEAVLDYFADPAGTGLWLATAVSTIGSWTSFDNHPHPITLPQPHFLVATIPEPSTAAMLASAFLVWVFAAAFLRGKTMLFPSFRRIA